VYEFDIETGITQLLCKDGTRHLEKGQTVDRALDRLAELCPIMGDAA